MAENNDYVRKAETIMIQATSRQAINTHDTWYTVEFSEQRSIPDIEGVNLALERELLWNTVHTECDNQVFDIEEAWRKHDQEVKNKITHK